MSGLSKSFPVAERLLTVIWVGSLWTVGFLVAPVLFRVLEERATAGLVAGRLFGIESYVGLVCGGLLLLIQIVAPIPAKTRRWRFLLLGVMLGLVLIGEFGLQPLLADLKAQGLAQGAEFARWHAVSAGLYVVNCLLGLAWVVVCR